MKVFWRCNGTMPPLAQYLKKEVPCWGGWAYACAQQISKEGTQLAIADIYNGKNIKKIVLDGIVYYRIPYRDIDSFDANSIPFWRQAIEDFAPDLIHLHGTECPVNYAVLEAADAIPVVASIQGLSFVCSRYYNAGLSTMDLLKSVALRDLARPSKTWLPFAKRAMKNRGDWEKKAIVRLRHVIGRTSWDRAHVLTLNPAIQYHFCNETLRENFYTASKWQYNSCEKHTIFASNPSYPLKGIHQLVKAFAFIVRHYPDAKLKIAGNDIMNLCSFKDYLRLPGYSLYLRRLIQKLNLTKNVDFLGPLSAEQMIAEFQKCHCYVLPAAIENSPNTLGEAQLLGVPSIATYVGGTPDMIKDGVDGFLYRFDEVELLAQKIIDLWQKGAEISFVSPLAIQTASMRHAPQNNAGCLMKIYQKIIDAR